MPLTREFKQTIMADLKDREYRAAYLAQAIEAMHAGELSLGKRMLRNYINATIGLEAVGDGSDAKPAPSGRSVEGHGAPRAWRDHG
jgi:hypothetical protein